MDGAQFDFALLHQTDRPYDHLYIECKGGRFAAEDAFEKHRLVEVLGEIFVNILNQTKLKAGMGCIAITSPENFGYFQYYLRQHGDPVVVRDDLDDNLDEASREAIRQQRENLDQIIPTLRDHLAADTHALIVLTIKREGEWKPVERGQATHQEIYNLPVYRLGRALVDSLRASDWDFGRVEILRAHQLFLVCRRSWDVFGIGDFYETYNAFVQEFTDQSGHITDALQLFEALRAHLSEWPERVVRAEHKDALQMDDNFITVLRITGVPQVMRDDTALALRQQMGDGAWVRYWIGGESASGQTLQMQVWSNQSASDSVSGAFFDIFTRELPSTKRRRERLAQQAESLEQVSVAQKMQRFVAIITSEHRWSEEYYGKVVALLKTQGFTCEVVSVRAELLNAVLTSTLAVPRM